MIFNAKHERSVPRDGSGVTLEQFQVIKNAINRMNTEEDPLQFMEHAGAILDQIPPGVPRPVRDHIAEIIDAYRRSEGLPLLPPEGLPQITVYDGKILRAYQRVKNENAQLKAHAPVARASLGISPGGEFEKTGPESPLQISPASDADIADSHPPLDLQPNPDAEVDIPDIDLARPYRFLSRVVGVVDGMLSNAKFARRDLDVGDDPRHISFDQYIAVRDVVGMLTRIRSVPPPEFFQNPRDFLEPLEGLIEGSDDPDSQGLREKLTEIQRKIEEIIRNFDNPEVSDFVPENVPFFVVERADNVSPSELVKFSDPTETAQRNTRVRDLHICINEMYFALQAMEIRDDRVLDLFADLVFYASHFLKIDVKKIYHNLQENEDRGKYIAEAMARRDANVLNAMKAVNYYREFEKCISEIRGRCSNFIENRKGSVERAMPHYRGWCGVFHEVVDGKPLNELIINKSGISRWKLSLKSGATIGEPRVIPGKEGKVSDSNKIVGGKFETVQVTLGEDEVLLDGASKKVKIIWPPYESVTGVPVTGVSPEEKAVPQPDKKRVSPGKKPPQGTSPRKGK
ncbi:MAG: hypothetical protein LBJ96_04340 [Holosporaceae bacterium]|nr:hypothetical protein [Holosporaceae bacterium]